MPEPVKQTVRVILTTKRPIMGEVFVHLQHKGSVKLWEFLGGKIEAGQTAEIIAECEVSGEAGIQIDTEEL